MPSDDRDADPKMTSMLRRIGRIQPVPLKSLQASEVYLPPFKTPRASELPSTSERLLEKIAASEGQQPSNLRIMQKASKADLAGVKQDYRRLVCLS